MAQDIAGKELVVGQTVAFCMAGKSQNMRLAKITKILQKTVMLDTPAWGERGQGPDVRRNHTAVVVVS